MKRVSLLVLLWLPVAVFAGGQKVIDLPISGMTCAFCEYGVQVNLGKVPGVQEARVSAEQGRARIVLAPGAEVDVQTLQAKVVEAGFTPGEATVRTTAE